MKKLLLLILLLASPCLAAEPIQLARMNPYVAASAGGAAAPVYTDCSTFPTGAALYWTGDHASGTEYACLSTSTTLNGAKSGSTIVASATDPGTASPSSAGNCLKSTANSQYIRWAVTAKNIFDSAEGRISMDVYMSNTTANDYLFKHNVDTSNRLYAVVGNDGRVTLNHVGQGTTVSMITSDTVPDATWTNVQFRWSVANNKISIKIGNGTWLDDSDVDAVTAFTSEPAYVVFTNDAITDALYVDNITVYLTSGL